MFGNQDVVAARLEGIRREYNELDTVWFMAGSLFQVIFCKYHCTLCHHVFLYLLASESSAMAW